MSSMLSIENLIYGGKAGHDLVRLFPYALEAALDILNIGFIDESGLMRPLGRYPQKRNGTGFHQCQSVMDTLTAQPNRYCKFNLS